MQLTDYNHRYLTGNLIFGTKSASILVTLSSDILIVDTTNCLDCYEPSLPTPDDIFAFISSYDVIIGKTLNYTVSTLNDNVCLEN